MKLTIKQLKLQNFKGIKNKTLVFDHKNAVIKGVNGSGKTSCADAFYWLFTGKNTALVNNPVITPIGAEECISRVEAEIEIDGKPCVVAKIQKYTSKVDSDGNRTASTKNTYEINSVEKTESAFIEELSKRGIDMVRFLTFSNPEQFMSDTSKKGREQLRETLFKMSGDISDIDIADEIKANEVKALLEKGYELNEIESMNKATIKKITEVAGKSNEIIDGRIQSIIDSKAQINVKELEKAKAEYEAELETVKEKIKSLLSEDNSTKQKIAELEGKLIELENAARTNIEEKTAKTSEKLRKAEKAKNDAEIDMLNAKNALDRISANMDGVKDSLENYRKLYKKVQDEVFDEESTKCPTCGRDYEPERIAEIKSDFEEGKTKRLTDYKKKGETYSKQLDALQKDYDGSKEKYEKVSKTFEAAAEKAKKIAAELTDIPRNPDLSQNKEYTETQNEIENLRAELQKKGDLKLQELSNRENHLNLMIRQAVGELAVADRNKELDEQIKVLRQEKKDAEVNKAAAEKTLYEVEKVKRTKNEKLSKIINSHFEIVDFKLWDYKKNGTYDDVIDLMIDGKPASTCANGSLVTLSKLDCINGLQKFFDQYMPVFVEDASLITANTKDRIKMNTQVIQLVATNDCKELVIEKGE